MFARRLRIKLEGSPNDNETAVLRQGALVHGEVAFTSPTFDRLSSVTVHFRGFSRVNVRSKVLTNHQEESTFFHRHYVIKPKGSGLLSLQARQPRTFSFKFMVPEMTDLSDAGIYPVDDDRVFEEEKHILPPSLSSKDSKNVKIIYQMYALVTHINQASGVGGQTYDPFTISNLLDLDYTQNALPYTLDNLPEHSAYFQRMSELHYTLGQTLDNEHHKIMEKSSSEPLPTFEVALKLPSTCVLGRAIPIVATISTKDHGTGRSLDYSGCDVSVLVAIQAETHSRCAGPHNRPSYMELKTQALPTDRMPMTVVTGSQYPIACSSDIISSWLPSFKSYFVSRTYSLVIDISMSLDRCKGKFKLHFKTPISAVHLSLSPGPQYQPSVIRDQYQHSEQLPSYEYARGLPNELPPAYEHQADLRRTTISVDASC
ncbi:hypothetical protein MMC20_002307 [Loxospora ochrophaea]|nr:hypothetical protein [Loxospora ochrophaea]